MSRRLYRDALDLFAGYPLAVNHFDGDPDTRMALVAGDSAFTLHQSVGRSPQPSYILARWASDDEDLDELVISAAEGCEARGISPGEAGEIIARAMPFPADGSLLGWVASGAVMALVACYADPEQDERPVISMMPRCGVPQGQWPPLTVEPHFGDWFWQHVRAGRLISLGGLIASAPGRAFWLEQATATGTGVCAVAEDVASPDGWVFPAGVYAYYKAIQAGRIPGLAEVLASPKKVDIAPRFSLRDAAGGAR